MEKTINKKNVVNAINNYIDKVNKENKNQDLLKIADFEMFFRLPEIMAVALWMKDSAETDDNVDVMIKAYNMIISQKYIPD